MPWAWIEQTRPGGLLLVDLKRSMAGNLVKLRWDGQRAEGRFLPWWAGFMAMTHTTDATPAPTLFAATAAENGLAGVEPAVVDEPSFAFFAHLHLPPGIGLRAAVTPDGQRAARLAADTTTDLDPEQLWYAVGRAHQRWRQLGRPAWERFGLTVTAKRQWVWLDQPTGPDTWTLDQFP